ncbi:MAG: MFS transporter [Candidatus Acidiferrales bacterium]
MIALDLPRRVGVIFVRYFHGAPLKRNSADASGRYAWYVVGVLMLCYTMSFVDRQILSLLVGPIKRDLMISDTRIGLLQGLAFAVFYTLAGLPIGRVVDTYGRRNPIAIGIFLWSVFTSACSIAKNFWTLFLARVGVGVGEATLSPAAFSLISDYFPKERLGLAISVYTMGIFIGSGVALIVGGVVVDAVMRMPALHLPVLGVVATWRLTFLFVGLPGLLVVGLIYTVREPTRLNLLRAADGRPTQLGLGGVVAQIRQRWQSFTGLSLAMIFQSLGSYAFLSWAPAFFERLHGWTAGHAGSVLGIIVLICGCCGMYVGGVLCDSWQRKSIHEAPLKVTMLSAIGSCLFLGTAMLFPNPRLSVALMAPGLFFQAMPIGSAYAAVQLIFPNQARGQVSALFMFILNLGGIGLGPLVPGLLNDYFFRDERMLGTSVSLTVVLASMLMMIILPLTYRYYRRDYKAMYGLDREYQPIAAPS